MWILIPQAWQIWHKYKEIAEFYLLLGFDNSCTGRDSRMSSYDRNKRVADGTCCVANWRRHLPVAERLHTRES